MPCVWRNHGYTIAVIIGRTRHVRNVIINYVAKVFFIRTHERVYDK
jgi:hypothetical protein